MVLIGVSDVATDWRVRVAVRKGYPLFAATGEHVRAMKDVGLTIAGTSVDLLGGIDVIVDCTRGKAMPGHHEYARPREKSWS